VIHLSGSRDERLLADNYRRENIPAYVAAFHHQMEEVYSAADFAIARAGAASLAELAAFGLPALLVPYPYAADDHQTRNAQIFVQANAAVMVREAELSSDLLAQKIRDLLGNPATLRTMSANIAALAPKNAANLIVETLERYCHPNDAVAA
jgi:UDP-N-acetylglucosamine--N-acetylmuramyl-(pentapeptide) pyrophosphoryl-undecaprenol N-acetylglucosamine transferase